MISEIHLEFFGPYPLVSEKDNILGNCQYADKSGIYLWAIQMPAGSYKISYLGETKRSFYQRMKEHVLHQFSGYYKIYDPDLLKNGVRKILWAGLWGKKRSDKLSNYVSNYLQLAPANLQYLKIQSVFLAPLKTETKTQKAIEAAIAHSIKKNQDAASLFDEEVRYYKFLPDQNNIKVIIHSEADIIGLPVELII